MKKNIVLVIAVLLLFTACGEAPAGEGEKERRMDADRSFAQFNTYVCETDDAVYFIAEDTFYSEVSGAYRPCSMLYYIDKATGISDPLCGRPECKHDDKNCNAYISSMDPVGLADYNGRLYWIALGTDDKYCIYSEAYDGTDRQTVRELDVKYLEDRFMRAVIMTAFHRGYVYLTANPSDIVDGEQQWRNYICAYSLDSGGEDFVILDEKCTISVDARTQLYENGMYIFVIDQSKEDFDAKLLRWDVETHELETLFDDKAHFAPGGDFWVTEEGVFMNGTTLDDPVTDEEGNSVWERYVYFYDFSTEEFEPVFPITGARGNIYGFSDGLFTVITDRSSWTNPEDVFDITAYDFTGQTVFADTFDSSLFPFPAFTLRYAGADENNLYFYESSLKYLPCISKDGGKLTVLRGNWEWD